MLEILHRHQTWECGDMPDEDKQSNEEDLISKGRILSGYIVPEGMEAAGSKIWIVTEWNRLITTILYPSEYQYGQSLDV